MESLSGNPLDLRFNVGALLQQPVGTSMKCRIEDMLKPAQASLVSGELTLTHTSRGLTVFGEGTADVCLECIRCLDNYCEHVDFVIEEELHPDPGFAHRRGADGFEECGEVQDLDLITTLELRRDNTDTTICFCPAPETVMPDRLSGLEV